MLNDLGVEDLSLTEFDELFNDNGTQDTPLATDTTHQEPSSVSNKNDVELDKKEDSKAFAKRLNKKIQDEREVIAKTMGFNSYDEMIKSREKKLIEDQGLDPEQVSPVIDELVQKKINNDPRIKELELIKRKQIEEFGKKELTEITALTNGEITKLEQLSPEVINLWKTKGSLKAAYLELEGEKLINKIRGEQSRGSTDHLRSTNGNQGVNTNTRPLTTEEKQIWKLFNPRISDEELNKKTKTVQ